ncbi:MAG: FtsX-like permease family protein [Bacteroidetes bacterium]|nr:MAG: FtsX-like permease family protein [Bacteroidota bacterium]
MIKSYFKTAWRSLLRGRSFSLINIGGLAIGMAGASLILLWLQNEISFDKFHINKDRLYEVYGLTNNTDGRPTVIPVVPQPLGPAIKQNFPEVEGQTRVKDINSFLITANSKSFTGINGSFVDPAFLQMFSFPLERGSEHDQLKNVYSITITENLAKKLFGNEDAVGKIVRIDSVDNFTVTGVLKNRPSNTRFDFEYLLSWDYLKKLGPGWSNESWLSNNTPVYVLLSQNTNLQAFNAKIKDLSRINAGRNDIWTHFLFPLRQWHLYSNFENGKPVGGRVDTVRIFAIIAVFILLIACINFMNLSTARSEKRAKEVGIRKVAGAGKNLLIGQFIAESFLTTCIAGAIALLTVQLVLPSFDKIIREQLSIPYSNPYFWLCTIAFISVTSLLAGSYPAFYLSSFEPISIFKKQFKRTTAIISPRRMLVVVQFTFAIILIISTIVVRNQVQHAQSRDKGYSNNNLIHVDFVGDIDKNYALIKQELISSNIASSVTKNMIDVTHGGGHTWGLRWANENPKDTNTTVTLYSADADWVKTASLHLIEGRDIDIYKYPADSFSVLLNETAVKLMRFTDPVGQTISTLSGNKPLRVVGVVKDYVIGSPYEEVPPTVIEGPGSWFNTMHIKLNPAEATAVNILKAEKVFKKYNPDYPLDYKFVDEEYAKQFDSEQRSKTMAGLFAALAIFISCLGLFGLSAYVAESRIKEIGVRKVLGASVLSIAKLLSMDFVKLVVISIMIATPVAAYVMNRWLEDYAYRIKLGWEIFFAAGLLAISIALTTVSFQSIKAAIANPVKSLRTE